MTIYAIFLCFSFGQCRAVQPGRIDEYGDEHPPTVYQSLAACQDAVRGLYYGSPPEPDDKGRYPVQGGAWYVCLSRKVNTWNVPQG